MGEGVLCEIPITAATAAHTVSKPTSSHHTGSHKLALHERVDWENEIIT